MQAYLVQVVILEDPLDGWSCSGMLMIIVAVVMLSCQEGVIQLFGDREVLPMNYEDRTARQDYDYKRIDEPTLLKYDLVVQELQGLLKVNSTHFQQNHDKSAQR